jgi:flagellar biosynthesis chaperone FliJ
MKDDLPTTVRVYLDWLDEVKLKEVRSDRKTYRKAIAELKKYEAQLRELSGWSSSRGKGGK